MSKIIKSALAIAAGAAMVAGVAVTPSNSLAWGDNGGGRRSYTIDQINHGALGNKIVFNSISDGVIGNEKNFVGARLDDGNNSGKDNVWNGNDITVEDGKTYLVRLYVHNNNPNGESAVSKNTRVAFDIPEASGKTIQVNGFIFSDNATPSEYWDYVNFNSTHSFHLEYVPGSAGIENNGYASEINGGRKQISDNIVYKAASENGVAISYDKDKVGEIPGCFTYAQYVTIKVRAVYDNNPDTTGYFTVSQKNRIEGSGVKWADAGYSVDAKVGDTIEMQVTFINNKSTKVDNVMIKAIMPKNLQYIPGSTTLINYNHPSGATVNQDTITTTGINIGSYASTADAYIRFKAKVIDNSLQFGSNTLVTWTQAGVGEATLQDYTAVVVQKASEAEPTLYNVTVDYVYEDGSKAADSYHGAYASGDPFVIESPVIAGYKADYTVIRGEMLKGDLYYKVTYRADKDDPTPSTPDEPTGPTTPDPVKPGQQLPTTGPVAGGVLGLGALTTSAGYYIASRRALRK